MLPFSPVTSRMPNEQDVDGDGGGYADQKALELIRAVVDLTGGEYQTGAEDIDGQRREYAACLVGQNIFFHRQISDEDHEDHRKYLLRQSDRQFHLSYPFLSKPIFVHRQDNSTDLPE